MSRRLEIDIAVLASGSGTNLQALLDHPEIRPHISLVVSDRPDAQALRRASEVAIPTDTVLWRDFPERGAFSAALAATVERGGAKAVVLAGFMRILGPAFIHRFPNRIINIHPSLLPAFPGARAVEQALEHGVGVTGVTVHIVDEKIDHGPIIAQVPVAVEPEDTVDTLHARIQVEEHRLLPMVVQALIEERLVVEGRTVRWL